METRFKLVMFVMIIAFCLITQNVIAQWQVNTNNPPGSDYWGQVNPASNAQSIGIGDFDGNSVVPEAALHINTNSGFLPSSPTFDPGEVFRTDGPSGLTAWRMFSGNVAANEKFSIVNPNGSKNIELSAVQNGDVLFRTLGNTPSSYPYERLRISQGSSSYFGSSYTSTTRIGISYGATGTGFNVTTPAAMLHLGSNVASGGYRTWMDVGTYMDMGGDHAYFGLKHDYSAGHTDAVISWGDSECSDNTDHHFRVISTAGYNGSCPSDPANTTDGLETMRITQNGFVGIGDYATLGSNPTRTLDVLGNAAIRTVTSGSSDKILIWNDGSDGLIQYRDLSSIIGVAACSTATSNYLTKWCASGDEISNSIVYEHPTTGFVGIGTASPSARLEVVNTSAFYGISANTMITGGGLANYGVFGSSASTGSSGFNVGVFGTAPSSSGTSYNIGVGGGQTTSSNILNIGVYGNVAGANAVNFGGMFNAGTNCTSTFFPINIGIYASAAERQQGDLCQPGTAGYFVGNVFATGTISPSDIILKDSIESISRALSIISLLQPKEYIFKRDSFPYMQLPNGKQYGLIAQQVDTILPDLVTTIMQPPILDTAGNILMDTLRFKTLNYTGLIPLLAAGVNELSESKLGTDGSGSINVLPKWSSDTANTLTASNIFDDGIGVGIGIDTPEHKLDVRNHDLPIGIYGFTDMTANNMNFGIVGTSKNGNMLNVGVAGMMQDSTAALQIAVAGRAAGSTTENQGVVGNAEFPILGSATRNVGVKGSAYGSDDENFAAHFKAEGDTGVNYAVYGRTSYTGANYWAGYFDGDVHTTGTVTWSSDSKLKRQIKDLESNSALALINELKPKNYEFNTTDYPSMNLPKGNQYGLVAQDVETVLPELVKDVIHPSTRDEDGKIIHPQVSYKAVNYTGFIPVLIGAVKEQQHTIDSLKEVINERLSSLENRLNGCCNANNYKTDPNEAITEGTNRQTVELSNLQTIVLDQNVPNPFAEQTSISYFIPEDAKNPQIIFFDVAGRVIKTMTIEKGAGTVTVYAQTLSSGTYKYSLLIDGTTIETKTMMKSR